MILSPPPRDKEFSAISWAKWFANIFEARRGDAAQDFSAENLTVAGTLTATGTTTLATSLTGALRADAGVVSVGMVRTADVTPLVGLGVAMTAAHSFGTVPLGAILEFVNLTAEQGFVAGEVMQITEQWNGATAAGCQVWKNTTTVGTQFAVGFLGLGRHKTTGAGFTPTAANWAYRFVIMK